MAQLRIVHIITGLHTGGAETMLYKLLSELQVESAWQFRVISLLEPGPMAEKIRALDVPVETVGMTRGKLSVKRLWVLRNRLRTLRPDVVQTWMYHADLLGGLAARLAGCDRVAWNVRTSTLAVEEEKWTTIWTRKVCAWLSSCIPDRIVTCAHVASKIHTELGYDSEKMSVIPNGFDVERFQPNADARRAMRTELNIDGEAPIVGMVGRFHVQKDHETFVRAAQRIQEKISNVQFVLCGDQVTWDNEQLFSWIQERDLTKHFHLLGRRDDIPRITASFDLATLSSSFGEAFPNVVGEAMACGVPCVVTEVGDAAKIVGDTGRTVRPRDEATFAQACLDLLEMDSYERTELGRAARNRVVENYSLPVVAQKYKALYESLVD